MWPQDAGQRGLAARVHNNGFRAALTARPRGWVYLRPYPLHYAEDAVAARPWLDTSKLTGSSSHWGSWAP